MNAEPELFREFEQIVAEIFQHYGFQVQHEVAWGNSRLDMLVTSPANVKAAVEVKLYRSQSVSTSTLVRAVGFLEAARKSLGAKVSIFVVGTRVSTPAKDVIRKSAPNVLIYDIDILAMLADDSPRLHEDLEKLVRRAFTFAESLEFQRADVNLIEDVEGGVVDEPPLEGVPEGEEPPPEIQLDGDEAPQDIGDKARGQQLCQQISELPTGKRSAAKFETLMTEALQYIFENDLTAWHPQRTTDSGMSRFDVVARIISEHDFWALLSSEFHTRYIIFEFKNYKEPISQGEIYTTEKYLHGPALRKAAIIISRVGGNKNALAACRGALRENGKMILNLTVAEVCEMLAARDAGDDHNAPLIAKLDNMLTKLER